MSAKHLIVLALVAYVTIQADSLPYATKGGQSYTQSYSEPLKGASYSAPQQQFAEPSYRQEAVVAAPVAAPVQAQASYSYEAPVKGHYQPEQRYEAPRAQQHYESAPVQSTYTQAEPLKSQYVPLVQRQAPVYQAPAYQAPAYQAPAYQAPAYQAPAYQAPAYQAPAYQAPAKGEYYQQSFERAPLSTQYEAAPIKGSSYTQSYSEPLKSTYQAPQPAVMPVVSAPAQVQAPAVQVESVAAPVKGQSFYQSEQRFESAPVRQLSSPKA